MFRHLDDFRSSWTSEASATLKLFQAIPDASLNQAVAPGYRDLRRLAWHITESLIEMPGHFGLTMEGRHLLQGLFIVDPPDTMAEICETYQKASQSLLEGLKSWDDATLEQEDKLYGETWKRGISLQVLIHHQIHHRGQMTVLMRQASLGLPAIYGPTREDWAAYGQKPPRV